MQTTFFVKLGIWVESLKARHYKNHMGRKKIKDRMGITLCSLKTYGYIDSKTKNY